MKMGLQELFDNGSLGNFFKEMENVISNSFQPMPGQYQYQQQPYNSNMPEQNTGFNAQYNEAPLPVQNQSNVIINLDTDTYTKASQVLSQLGIPLDTAVSMFLRQVAIKEAIPFDISLQNTPPKPPVQPTPAPASLEKPDTPTTQPPAIQQ